MARALQPVSQGEIQCRAGREKTLPAAAARWESRKFSPPSRTATPWVLPPAPSWRWLPRVRRRRIWTRWKNYLPCGRGAGGCWWQRAAGKYADAQSLIDAAKANPGEISVGIPGSNNVNQAYATLLGQAAGTDFLFMPFDGGSRVITEILGGHVDAGVLKPSEVIAQVKSNDLMVLGVFNKDGLAAMPDVPTFESLGYDVFTLGDIRQASYIMAPAGLDAGAKEKLASMFKEALESDDFKAFAEESGLVSRPITGEELDVFLDDVYVGLENASKEIWAQ